jgi:hypothetical protein
VRQGYAVSHNQLSSFVSKKKCKDEDCPDMEPSQLPELLTLTLCYLRTNRSCWTNAKIIHNIQCKKKRELEPIVRSTRIRILEGTAQLMEQCRRNPKGYVNWTSHNSIPKIF